MLTPLPNESAADFLKRQAVEDCAQKYVAVTGPAMLATTISNSRTDGAKAVFDSDAEHANAVLSRVAELRGMTIAELMVEDLLIREVVEVSSEDPGSPAAGKPLQVVPSDLAAFTTELTKLKAAKAALLSLTYTVAPV